MAKAKTRRIKVEVTAGDIRRGKRGNDYACAVALGVRRAVKAAKYQHAFESQNAYHSVFRLSEGQWGFVKAAVPPKVTAFIRTFDIDDNPKSQLKPFSFTLRLPN